MIRICTTRIAEWRAWIAPGRMRSQLDQTATLKVGNTNCEELSTWGSPGPRRLVERVGGGEVVATRPAAYNHITSLGKPETACTSAHLQPRHTVVRTSRSIFSIRKADEPFYSHVLRAEQALHHPHVSGKKVTSFMYSSVDLQQRLPP